MQIQKKREAGQGEYEERESSHYMSKWWLDTAECRVREAGIERVLKGRLRTMKGRQEKDTKMGNNVAYALSEKNEFWQLNCV